MRRRGELTHILIISKDSIYANRLTQTLTASGYVDIEVKTEIGILHKADKKKLTVLIFDTSLIDNPENITSLWTRRDRIRSNWALLVLDAIHTADVYSWGREISTFVEVIAKVDIGLRFEKDAPDGSVKEGELSPLEEKQISLVLEHLSKVLQIVKSLDKDIRATRLYVKPLSILAIGASIVYIGIQLGVLWIAITGVSTLIMSLLVFLFFLKGMGYEG